MTYTVVGICPDTGAMGVATQSHFVAVGAIVPWIRSDSGVIATQAWGDRSYGAQGLIEMRQGSSPRAALDVLLGQDEHRESRQLLFMNRAGTIAAHTGTRCIAYAEHALGDGVACAANMMIEPGVPDAMIEAWDAGAGTSLPWRLLSVLQSAQDMGGELRGQQSAALTVVEAGHPNWWDALSIELRVDDHRDALGELGRLLPVRLAYYEAHTAEQLEESGEEELAAKAYARSVTLLPGSAELSFWRGVMLANKGRIDAAQQALAISFAEHDGWRELLRRLPASGLLDVSEEVLDQLSD